MPRFSPSLNIVRNTVASAAFATTESFKPIRPNSRCLSAKIDNFKIDHEASASAKQTAAPKHYPAVRWGDNLKKIPNLKSKAEQKGLRAEFPAAPQAPEGACEDRSFQNGFIYVDEIPLHNRPQMPPSPHDREIFVLVGGIPRKNLNPTATIRNAIQAHLKSSQAPLEDVFLLPTPRPSYLADAGLLRTNEQWNKLEKKTAANTIKDSDFLAAYLKFSAPRLARSFMNLMKRTNGILHYQKDGRTLLFQAAWSESERLQTRLQYRFDCYPRIVGADHSNLKMIQKELGSGPVTLQTVRTKANDCGYLGFHAEGIHSEKLGQIKGTDALPKFAELASKVMDGVHEQAISLLKHTLCLQQWPLPDSIHPPTMGEHAAAIQRHIHTLFESGTANRVLPVDAVSIRAYPAAPDPGLGPSINALILFKTEAQAAQILDTHAARSDPWQFIRRFHPNMHPRKWDKNMNMNRQSGATQKGVVDIRFTKPQYSFNQPKDGFFDGPGSAENPVNITFSPNNAEYPESFASAGRQDSLMHSSSFFRLA